MSPLKRRQLSFRVDRFISRGLSFVLINDLKQIAFLDILL
jgi:hypothetical protein